MLLLTGYCIVRHFVLSSGDFFILFLPYFSLDWRRSVGRHFHVPSTPYIGLNCKLAGVKRGLASAIATLPSYVVGYMYALRTSSLSRILLPLSASDYCTLS